MAALNSLFHAPDDYIQRLYIASKAEAAHDDTEQDALTQDHDISKIAARGDRFGDDLRDDLLGQPIVQLRCTFVVEFGILDG